MICIKCKGIVALQAFTNSVCKICGVPITTHHMPAYKICEECSKKYNLCQQCGENIKKNIDD
jgi:rRNA maturation endonuclease Nob1